MSAVLLASGGNPSTGTGPDYTADVTVTAGGRVLRLGGVAVANRRLALRWLRRQALRLADAHGQSAPASPWWGVRDVRTVTFHGTDAPEQLRAWAGDAGRQDDAMSALEAGLTARLTVVDPAVELSVTLTGRPVGPERWRARTEPARGVEQGRWRVPGPERGRARGRGSGCGRGRGRGSVVSRSRCFAEGS